MVRSRDKGFGLGKGWLYGRNHTERKGTSTRKKQKCVAVSQTEASKQRTDQSEGLGHGSVNCFGAGHTRLAVLARGPDWGEELKADDASPSLLAWREKAPMARKIIISPVTSQSLLRRRITTSIAYCSATVCVTASQLS